MISCHYCGKPLAYEKLGFLIKQPYKKILCYDVCISCYSAFNCKKTFEHSIHYQNKRYTLHVTIKIKPSCEMISFKIFDKKIFCEIVVTKDFQDLKDKTWFLTSMKARKISKPFSIFICNCDDILHQIYVYVKKDLNQMYAFIGV